VSIGAASGLTELLDQVNDGIFGRAVLVGFLLREGFDGLSWTPIFGV